jgi:hypothetical protein
MVWRQAATALAAPLADWSFIADRQDAVQVRVVEHVTLGILVLRFAVFVRYDMNWWQAAALLAGCTVGR